MEQRNYHVDLHTHTIASGHAYSSLQEMVKAAQEKGLKMLGITEHGPLMKGSCQEIYFRNLSVIPRQWDGLKVLMGAELNVYDFEGHVDISEDTLRKLDVRIGSFHMGIMKCGSLEEMSSAIKATLANPYIDIFGHPDDGRYLYDYSLIANEAAKNNKIIEINNTSLRPGSSREHAYENDLQLLEECKKCNVPILIGSDAHISLDVGAHEMAEQVITESDYPRELVLNYDTEQLCRILEQHEAQWS